jgi:hypothetical protein
MSTTTPTPTPTPSGFTLSNREEAIIWIVGSFLLYLSAGGVPLNSPVYVRETFAAIGASMVVIKYVLTQLKPPNLPVSHESLLSFVVVALSVTSGVVSQYLGSFWYGSLVVEGIAAAIAVYTAMGGTVPSLPATSSSSTAKTTT